LYESKGGVSYNGKEENYMRKFFLIKQSSVLVAILVVFSLCSTTIFIPILNAKENKNIIDNLINQDANEEYSEFLPSGVPSIDFEKYWMQYINATEFWLGHNNSTAYNKIINFFFKNWHADNYFDWHKQVNTGVGNFWNYFAWLAAIDLVLAIFIAIFNTGIISPFVWLFCFIPGILCSAGMGYSFNGINNFQRLKDYEVDIIIHVVNETGDDIPGLDIAQGGILAWNQDAVDRCNDLGNTMQFNPIKFQYLMRPVQGNDSEDGWYSLSARDSPKYQKAVCPPGSWKISISATDIYKPKTIDIGDIGKSNVVVLDNITLDKWPT
jgi:hypothetical protein